MSDLFTIAKTPKAKKQEPIFTINHDDYADKILALAQALFQYLKRGKDIPRKYAKDCATKIFGGSDANGMWVWKDVYEAQEVACILMIRHYIGSIMRKSLKERMASFSKLQCSCLTQSKRSEKSVKFNQFSTPLPYALFAVECANLTSDDIVLEPSAGTGIIGAIAQMYGAEVIVNEYEPQRFAITKQLFKDAYNLDARYIDDNLDLEPTAIIMNPPFNMEDRRTAQVHVQASYRALAKGGRIVSITARDDDIENSVLRGTVSGQVFYKHGTNVATCISVTDKGREPFLNPIVQSLEDKLEFLEVVNQLPPRLKIEFNHNKKLVRELVKKEQVKFKAVKQKQQVVVSEEIHWETPIDVEYELHNWVANDDIEDVGIYQNYTPQSVNIIGAKEHPADLVQSISMNSVAPPQPTYKPSLPKEIIARGILSEAQLETVIYAGEAHNSFLDGKYICDPEKTELHKDEIAGRQFRRGYFLGDGTGCGKGRQVAGVILDNWLKGRKKAVWFSLNDKLLEDAQRDWMALGGKKNQIVAQNKFKFGSKIVMESGIMFVTYGTLSQGARGKNPSRLEQLVEWLGTDFDGVIAFDEAHAMANAIAQKGSRGIKSGSKRGILGLRLQYLLPHARIMYIIDNTRQLYE